MTGSEPTLREAAEPHRRRSPCCEAEARRYLAGREDEAYAAGRLAGFEEGLDAAHPPAAPDAEHEALRDRMLAWAHLEKEARKSGYPEEYRQRMRDNADEALNDLDAYLDAHPALLAKYEALWGAIEEKG